MYVEWEPGRWAELREKLESLKGLAGVEGVPDEVRRWEVNGNPAEVEPTGARLGSGRKGPYFAYRLGYMDLAVMIADRSGSHKRVPSVVVRANGEACLLHGPEVCLERGRSLVTGLGGVIVREKLSRVDMALDMPGVGMADVMAAFNEGRYICRAKSRGFAESNGITLRFGESPLLLRIYDKLAETLKCANPLKGYAMIERRWGGRMPGQAIRVEFELRREALKERGIDSVVDYFEKRADLVHYLAHEWFRMTAHVVDREHKNQSRAEVSALWRDVQQGFGAWAGSPTGCSLAPLDREAVDVRQLFKQALGVVKTAGRYQGHGEMNWDELATYATMGLRSVWSG